jgi:Bacterial PH domain
VNEPADALYRPFRPQRARLTAWLLAGCQLAVLIGLALLLPATGPTAFHWYDRLGIVLIGLAVGFGLSRFARLEAMPDGQGLRVRNVFVTRRLDWAQIVSVRFGGGNPWATLDLSDGDTLAVMAIQRADGDRAGEQARRLATLVALHSRTSRDD